MNSIVKMAYLELRKLGQIRSYLDIDSTKTLACAFILSRIDYCNSLLINVSEHNLNKLQMVQNNATRLIYKVSKREHVTPLLHELHWLPVRARIEYKIAITCFKSRYCLGPMYLNTLVSPYNPPRDLRSSKKNTLCVPETKLKTYGDRAFTSAGPSLSMEYIACPPQKCQRLRSFQTGSKNISIFKIF